MKCSTLCSTSGAIRIASIFLLAYLVVSSAGADMYKWVDASPFSDGNHSHGNIEAGTRAGDIGNTSDGTAD